MIEKHTKPDNAQRVYGQVLHWVSTLGIVFVILGFAIYIFELFPLKVPISDIAQNWHLGAEELNHTFHLPTGWTWVNDMLHGDVLSFASIVYLAGGTIICLVAVAVVFFREKNMIYTTIAVLQILVLVFAASGIIGSGH